MWFVKESKQTIRAGSSTWVNKCRVSRAWSGDDPGFSTQLEQRERLSLSISYLICILISLIAFIIVEIAIICYKVLDPLAIFVLSIIIGLNIFHVLTFLFPRKCFETSWNWVSTLLYYAVFVLVIKRGHWIGKYCAWAYHGSVYATCIANFFICFARLFHENENLVTFYMLPTFNFAFVFDGRGEIREAFKYNYNF